MDVSPSDGAGPVYPQLPLRPWAWTMNMTADVALALTSGSRVIPAASHRATVAMAWAYMLVVPRDPLPDCSRFISQLSPFSTVFLYLVPNLCVSPAARKGKRAMPTAATLSFEEPSNSQLPSLSCLRASHARPRATAASD